MLIAGIGGEEDFTLLCNWQRCPWQMTFLDMRGKAWQGKAMDTHQDYFLGSLFALMDHAVLWWLCQLRDKPPNNVVVLPIAVRRMH